MAGDTQAHNPYVGPRPFEMEDKARFFGRDREADELLSLVVAHRALLLYAGSGAGKTSLINAGLIPLLEEEGFEILPLARVQGRIPDDVPPAEVPNPYTLNTLISWAEAEADCRPLIGVSLADFLEARPHLRDDAGLARPRVAVFDQFEELFTFYADRWRDREGFFKEVSQALEADPLLRVLFALREDYVAQIDPYAPIMPNKLRARFRLERLREGAALAAVKGPLRDTQRYFGEGVAEALVGDLMTVQVVTTSGETEPVRGQFVEPVQLQVACRSLWERLPSKATVISPEDLAAFGDVNQALAGFYETAMQRAAKEASVAEGDLRDWFEQILITPFGTRGTVYRGREQTGGIPNAALDVLETRHLVRGEWRAGARWYELTHDRFIGPIRDSNARWWAEETEERARQRRRVVTWLAIVATFLALLVVAGISAWTAARQTAQIIGGSAQQAVTSAAAESQKTAEAAQAVVQEAAAKAVTAEREVTQVAEQAVISATAVAESMATATAAVGDASDATSSVLRSRVRPLKPGLSVSAVTRTANTLGAFVRDADGRFYLITTDCIADDPVVQPGRYDAGQVPDDEIGYFVECPPLVDGASVANLVGLVRLEPGTSFETAIPGIGPVLGTRELAVGMAVRKLGRGSGLTRGEITEVGVPLTITLPDPDTGEMRHVEFEEAVISTLVSEPGDGGALVVDDEGYAVGVLVAASTTITILAPIEDVLEGLGVELVHTGQELLSLVHPSPVLGATWSPDGQRLVTAGDDGTARVWLVGPGLTEYASAQAPQAVLSGHTGSIRYAAWDPTGTRIVTASADGTARVWLLPEASSAAGEAADAATLLAVLEGHLGPVWYAAWDPTGTRIATASDDAMARVWAADTGAELAVLEGHTGAVRYVAWDPAGARLVTASADGTARMWAADTGAELAVLEGHTDSVKQATWSADGTRILTASADATARIWDAGTGESLLVLTGHGEPVWPAAWDPGGTYIMTAGTDGTARVWGLESIAAGEAETGKPLTVLHGHTGPIWYAAWDPGRTRIVTASADGTARVWGLTFSAAGDAASGKELFSLAGHRGEVLYAAWSPSGLRIATVGEEGTARVWQGR